MNIHISILEEPAVTELSRELITMVNIDSSGPKRCVVIGSELKEAFKVDLIQFMLENVSTFTW